MVKIIDSKNEVAKDFIAMSAYYKSDRFQNWVTNKKDFKILDIGCEVPILWFDLMNDFPSVKYLGIDKCSCQEKVVFKLKERNSHLKEKLKGISQFYSIYKMKMQDENRTILSKQKFEELRRKYIHLNCSLANFLENRDLKEEKFDFIIASNIFHFYKKKTDSVGKKADDLGSDLKNLLDRLKSNGKIFLRYQYDKYRFRPGIETYHVEEFKDLLFSNFEEGLMVKNYKDEDLWLTFINNPIP